MTELAISCAAFVLLHLGVSGTPLRGALRNILGENGYLGVYSLAAFASLGAMIYTYGGVGEVTWLWPPSELAYKVTKTLMLFAIILIVMGTLTANPTSVKQESAVDSPLSGIIRITRHPTQCGISLFCIAHLIANGDTASVTLFGSVLVVSVLGVVSMDRRKRAESGEGWQRFFAETSVIPFAAIAGGRTRLSAADINWVALIVGIALYVSIYWLHDMVSGGASLF